MLDSTFDRVLGIVDEWKPKEDYEKEAGYRNDLMAFIREELKKGTILTRLVGSTRKHRIRKESGRHLADIGIDEKIGIELKRELVTQGVLDRLIGQIRRFVRSYDYVIVVLCGEVNDEMVDDLRVEFKDYQDTWESGKTVKIVEKTTSK